MVRREEWMIELPDSKRTQLGLGSRKFRTNAAPDMSDRSSWTDTPKDKARKQLMGEEEEELDTKKLEIAERNKEMELLSKKSEKKEKSLLEMHQKEIKRKKKKEERERGDNKPERRPFSREVDLQTNRFDEAQKRSIIKKAQLLDSRFSSGESKFL